MKSTACVRNFLTQLWSNEATWDTFTEALPKRFPEPMVAERGRAIQSILENPQAMDRGFTLLRPPPTSDGFPDTTAQPSSPTTEKSVLDKLLEEIRCTPNKRNRLETITSHDDVRVKGIAKVLVREVRAST